MPPPPPTRRGSRCRASGRRRISHTAETIIARPLSVQSNPRVASADLTADHSRNTSTPALVVAKPRTRNAAPISRSTSTLAAIRTPLVVDRLFPQAFVVEPLKSIHSSHALELCRRSCVSKEACEVVNHHQRPSELNCFVDQTDIGGKAGDQRPDREQNSKCPHCIAARTWQARCFVMQIDQTTNVSPLKSNSQQQNCQTPGGHISM